MSYERRLQSKIDFALEISGRFEARPDLWSMAAELSEIFSGEFRTKRIRVELQPGEPTEHVLLTVSTNGGLKGIQSLDDVIVWLLAAAVAPQSSTENRKRPNFISYPLAVAALSSLSRRSDLGAVAVRVGEVARKEALDLAAASAYLGNSRILEEMAAGIVFASSMGNPPTIFASHVAAVCSAYSEIRSQSESEPTKGMVKSKAIEVLSARGLVPIEEKDAARWRTILKAAGLGHLEQDRKGARRRAN